MKKVIILEEKEFARLVAESNHIKHTVSVVRETMNDKVSIKNIKEALKSIECHADKLKMILDKTS